MRFHRQIKSKGPHADSKGPLPEQEKNLNVTRDIIPY